MTIILGILKVAGWILLILLMLVVLSILLLLFVPVRYRIRGEKGQEISLDAQVSWLLHFVRVAAYIEDHSLIAELRILFFRKRIYPEMVPEDDFAGWDGPEESYDEGDELREAEKQAIEQPGGAEKQSIEQPGRADKQDTEQSGEEKKGSKQKWKLFRRIQSFFRDIRSMFRGISGKLKERKRQWRHWKRMLQDERNKSAISHLKKEILFLLKCMCPGRLKLTAEYSTGSPDTTGQLLGVIALFPVGYRNRWQIYPDFTAEEAYVRGSTDIKGRFFLFHVVGIGFRILFDSNCRRLFALLRR